ncbi:hypothetical protein EQG49_11635 [Periweissella cryptocerci]|uniref:DUF1453 family protein n=1 Tax=Periweissella cryptocerci TaxID=2506420 RepID=A0A4P6YW61_9LACO|nr:hypothetical protein [Periweissella cryptocerci]QBO37058.1 hypothetical protein EQG49_11635 [Periweissella cryptocerci]
MMMNVLIGVVVMGFVLARQLRVREVENKWVAQFIMGGIGFVGFLEFLQHQSMQQPMASLTLVLVVLGSLVLAVATAFVRVPSYEVTVVDGKVFRKGTVKSVILWLLTIVLHVGYDQLVTLLHVPGMAAVGTSTLLIYLAVSFGMQKFLILKRVKGESWGATVIDA